MGKKGKKASTYVHKHNPNPKAHNSDELRASRIHRIQVGRCENIVQKIRNSLECFIPNEVRVKTSINPLFQLRGAARPAQEFYRPPGWKEDEPPRNIIAEYQGRLWEHSEGQSLLRALLELGITQHNIAKRTRDAISTFTEMLSLDAADNIMARHHLIRCYMDDGDAALARSVLLQFSNDKHCVCLYTLALLEFISLSLDEDGSSDALRTDALLTAYAGNPFAIFALAYSDTFTDVVEHMDRLIPSATYPGSVEDALLYFHSDVSLWRETEGALEWVREVVDNEKLQPPATVLAAVYVEKHSETKLTTAIPNSDGNCSEDRVKAKRTSHEETVRSIDLHAMCLGMFQTAMDMANSTSPN